MNTAGLLVLIGVILAGLSALAGAFYGNRTTPAGGPAWLSPPGLAVAVALVGIGVLLGHPHVS